MTNGLLLTTNFLFGAALLALAFWILYLKFDSRVNQAFAAFLVVRGMVTLLNRVAELAPAASEPMWRSQAVYYLLAAPFALAGFVAVYLYRPGRPPAWLLLGVWGGMAALEIAFALEHCSVQCWESGSRSYGPLWTIAGLLPVACVAAAWAIGHQVASHPAPGSASAYLVGTGLLLLGVQDAATQASLTVANQSWRTWGSGVDASAINALLGAAALLAGMAVAISYGALARRPSATGPRWWVPVAAATVAAVTGLVYGGLPSVKAIADGGQLLQGLLRLAVPLLIVFALVRHRLFELDVKLRWTVSRSTMAAVFVAVFFVVSKLVETAAQEHLSGLAAGKAGLYVGGGVTGLCLFAITPLERLGRRVAGSLVPVSRTRNEMSPDQRVALYREQALLVWADGSMGRKERQMLDLLRERLGLTPTEASHLEAEALNAAAPRVARPRRRIPVRLGAD